MNYAVVVFFFVVFFALGFWYTHGRHSYTGPLTHSPRATDTSVVVPNEV